MTRERIDHPERDVRAGVGLHVHGDSPWLAAVLENSNLQMRSRLVVFALVAVGPASKHTVQNRHVPSLRRTVVARQIIGQSTQTGTSIAGWLASVHHESPSSPLFDRDCRLAVRNPFEPD